MDTLDDALCFAVEKHSGQKRKTGNIPFVLHPMEVAAITATMTEDREVIAAAVLHDTVEDAGVTIEEIKERFGDRVAVLVAAETENKRTDRPATDTWRIRKEESLAELEAVSDPAAKIVWLADKLSNMRSFYRSYRTLGDRLWEKFHQKDPAAQAWYYREVARLTSDLGDTDAYREYVSLMNVVFQNVTEE